MGSLALEDRWIGVSARTPGGDVRARKSRACQCPANATRPPKRPTPAERARSHTRGAEAARRPAEHPKDQGGERLLTHLRTWALITWASQVLDREKIDSKSIMVSNIKMHQQRESFIFQRGRYHPEKYSRRIKLPTALRENSPFLIGLELSYRISSTLLHY